MSVNKQRSCACCKKQLSKVPGKKKVLSLRDVNFYEVSLAQTFAVPFVHLVEQKPTAKVSQ